jgi:hypothetical protein
MCCIRSMQKTNNFTVMRQYNLKMCVHIVSLITNLSYMHIMFDSSSGLKLLCGSCHTSINTLVLDMSKPDWILCHALFISSDRRIQFLKPYSYTSCRIKVGEKRTILNTWAYPVSWLELRLDCCNNYPSVPAKYFSFEDGSWLTFTT